MENKHSEMTQKYSTWGDKLLRHPDVLYSMKKRTYKPINIQIALCEVCDSHCPFCSVANRPLKKKLRWEEITMILDTFKELGAKAVELTGGGNPMLWRDGGRNINDIVQYAGKMGYNVGIITNSEKLTKIEKETVEFLSWVRVSLAKLDEGHVPEDYDFGFVPYEKLGLSYIIHDGTNNETVENIARVVDLHRNVKFVRVAGDCLKVGNNKTISQLYKPIFDQIDTHGKIFIKEIEDNDQPFEDGCYVGMIRPYIAPHPEDGPYQVYICTSHVLQKQNYDLDYSLGSIFEIRRIWENKDNPPYCVKGNEGRNWHESCKHCFYYNNNKILHTVMNKMPDENFA